MARARRTPPPSEESAAETDTAAEGEAQTEARPPRRSGRRAPEPEVEEAPADLSPPQSAPVDGVETSFAPEVTVEDPPSEEIEDQELWEGPGGALRHVMWLRGQLVFENLDHFQENPSVDVVHDLRVATRRLSSSLDLAAELIGEGPVGKARKQLSQLRQGLGELRDLHVQLEWLKEHQEAFPQLGSRIRELEAREAKCWSQATKAVKKVRARKLGRRLEGIDALVAALVESSEGWHECLAMLKRAVAKRFAAVIARHQHVEPGVGDSLHALRIAFKKFRYKAELVGQLEDPPRGEDHAKAMRSVQRALGGLQDIEVLTRGLEKGWVETPPDREEQMAVMEHLLGHRREFLAELEQTAELLHTLWEAPEH